MAIFIANLISRGGYKNRKHVVAHEDGCMFCYIQIPNVYGSICILCSVLGHILKLYAWKHFCANVYMRTV